MLINIKKENNPVKKWAEDLNSISPGKTLQMINRDWKDAQYCYLLEKLKSKLPWDITLHSSE